MTSEAENLGVRVLVLAPTVRDGVITAELLERAGMASVPCADIATLVQEAARGAGALVMTEEAMYSPEIEQLLNLLNAQPAWSEIPVVMMMRGGADSPVAARLLKALRNVTLLERPAPMRSVESAVQAAVRGRQRQYQMRDHLQAIRQSEARATQLQQQLETAVQASELGTFHCDMPLRDIVWNDRCKAHFWLAADAVVDFNLFYSILHPEDRERVREAVRQCVDEGKVYDIEYRTISPEGKMRWVRATGRRYTDESGNPVRFDGTTQDITERKLIEQERESLLESERNARTDAERANRIKDEFLATVSHELRTPLNAILGWTQLLQRGRADPERVAEAVDVIDRNARLQAQLIEDLLDMSRIISGKIRLEQAEIDIVRVIEAAVQSVRPVADEKRIKVIVDGGAGCEGEAFQVRGDAGRLQQVLWNLLSNAVKFTPEGGRITIAVRLSRTHVQIRVSDTGEGMDPASIPHMFERFRQADGSTSRRHGGLGLGLAIVKQLVELHGGMVTAESPGRGQGSTFVISLPRLSPVPDGVEVGEALGLALPPPLQRRFADLAGLKVLVVDDDADARRLVKRLLSECQATVSTAASAVEALRVLEHLAPDVLISDIGMPGMDGYEFIAKVRASGAAGNRLPAAAVTAFSRPSDKSRALRAGYQMHVAKPIEPAELIAVVANLGGRAAGN